MLPKLKISEDKTKMAVYYYPLWERLSRYGMQQKELCKKAHLSTGTIFQMKKDRYVALEVLERIAKVLDCDIGDLITNKKKEGIFPDGLKGLHNELLLATQEYMKKNNYAISDIARTTTLSVNTVKKFLKGEKLAEISYQKLRVLGDDWYNMVEMELHKYIAIYESKHKSRQMTFSLFNYKQ